MEIIPIILVAGLGFWYSHMLFGRGVRLASRNTVREAPLLASVGFLFVLVNIVYLPLQNSPAMAWYIPVPIDYYAMSIGWLLDACGITFVSATIVGVAFKENHSLHWPLAILALAALTVADWQVRQRAGPPELQPPRETPDGIVLQTSGSTCAAAAGANIARHFGRKATEADMVHWMGTTEDGTSKSQMIYGLAKVKLIGTKHYSPTRTITDIHPPAILSVDLVGADDGHAVAYMGIREGKAEIWNPTSGKSLISPEALKRDWRGRAIEVRPMPDS